MGGCCRNLMRQRCFWALLAYCVPLFYGACLLYSVIVDHYHVGGTVVRGILAGIGLMTGLFGVFAVCTKNIKLLQKTYFATVSNRETIVLQKNDLVIASIIPFLNWQSEQESHFKMRRNNKMTFHIVTFMPLPACF